MKKILVVSYSGTTYPFEGEKGVTCILLWPYHSFGARCFIRFFFFLGLSGLILSLRFARFDFSPFDVIVVSQLNYASQVLQFVRRKNKTCKLVYLLWDTLFKIRPPRLYNEKKELQVTLKRRKRWNYQVVSFDKRDCVRYGLNYQNQFAPRIDVREMEQAIDADIFFVGQDKERLGIVKKINAICMQYGLQFSCWLFPLWPKTKKDYGVKDWKFIKDGRSHYPQISYEEIISEDMKCRAILDLVQDGQHGITWRPLEALFYKKKLITNFSEIKEYDFYRKENIFILGEDDIDCLREFIDKPYVEVPEEIVRQYTFNGWLEKVMR